MLRKRSACVRREEGTTKRKKETFTIIIARNVNSPNAVDMSRLKIFTI